MTFVPTVEVQNMKLDEIKSYKFAIQSLLKVSSWNRSLSCVSCLSVL
jgi:hypothetical protein